MQWHCFDNTDRVLYHPTSGQHLNLHAHVDIVRMDNQGDETLGNPKPLILNPKLLSLNRKRCSYIEQMASVVQHIELADK